MPRHRRHAIAFKRQLAQAYLAGESLHGLAKQHDVCRNLIRLWDLGISKNTVLEIMKLHRQEAL